MPGQFNGVRFRELREEKGFTREQFAIEVVRSAQTIFSWEAGRKTPHTETIAVIAQILGVAPSELTRAPRRRTARSVPAGSRKAS